MSDPTQTPIVVNPSSTPTTIETSAGQLIPLLAGVLATYAHLSNQDALALAPILLALASWGWRVWRARSNHAKLVVTAHASPDAVAVVQSK